MIISNSKKFIFIHIHKAAGTSIHFAIDKTLGWNDISIGSTPYGEQIQRPYHRRFNIQKHSPARDVMHLVGNRVWSDYFTFTFVRHPYRRVVSLYSYIDKLVAQYGKKRYLRYLPAARFQKEFWNWPVTKAFLETKTFSKFIRHPCLSNAVGMKPQHRSFVDEKGNILVDFIGRVERIGEDFEFVSGKIGLPQTRLKKKNQSISHKSHPPAIQETDYDLLYELYKADFDILGYDPNWRLKFNAMDRIMPESF